MKHRCIRYYETKIASACVRSTSRVLDRIAGKLIQSDSKKVRAVGWKCYDISYEIYKVDAKIYADFYKYIEAKRAK